MYFPTSRTNEGEPMTEKTLATQDAPASLPWEVSDPMEGLPPTARRILGAAHHLLETEGFKALTLSRIACAAGEHKASIGYYFGNKGGLLIALADYMIHDYTVAGLGELEGLPVGEKRARAVVKMWERIVKDTHANRDFFEILVLGLRDTEIRERMASAYDRYRKVHLLELLGDTDGVDEQVLQRAEPLATLSLAVIDGLAIQALLGYAGASLDPALHVLEEVLAELASRDWVP